MAGLSAGASSPARRSPDSVRAGVRFRTRGFDRNASRRGVDLKVLDRCSRLVIEHRDNSEVSNSILDVVTEAEYLVVDDLFEFLEQLLHLRRGTRQIDVSLITLSCGRYAGHGDQPAGGVD